MEPDSREEQDILEFTDDEGSRLLLQVVRYFFYNGEEYALLRETGSEETDGGFYVMKVIGYTNDDGEEMEEFVPPAEDLLETLLTIGRIQLSPDE